MKVARRKNWTAAASQAAVRKTKRKISKAGKASRKVAPGGVPKARRSAARKRKRATLRKAPKAKPRNKATVLAAVADVVVRGRMGPRYADILTRDALAFLAELHRRFDGKRRVLLAARAKRQKRFDEIGRASCRE